MAPTVGAAYAAAAATGRPQQQRRNCIAVAWPRAVVVATETKRVAPWGAAKEPLNPRLCAPGVAFMQVRRRALGSRAEHWGGRGAQNAMQQIRPGRGAQGSHSRSSIRLHAV
eukprot:363221-Chlamydomonas_euryale.AAC.32